MVGGSAPAGDDVWDVTKETSRSLSSCSYVADLCNEDSRTELDSLRENTISMSLIRRLDVRTPCEHQQTLDRMRAILRRPWACKREGNDSNVWKEERTRGDRGERE